MPYHVLINRGEWIRKKWYVRGFIKMHIAVDKESKEIVAMKITKEYVHDGKKMIPMIKEVLKKERKEGRKESKVR